MNKQRFEHPALDNVYSALDAIEEAEARIKAAKQQLQDAVMNLPTKIGENEDLHDEVFHQLYWFNDKIPATWLKEAFQRTHPSHARKDALSRLMRSAYLEINCVRCNRPFRIEITSRSDLQNRQEWIKRDLKHSDSPTSGWATTCKECKAEKEAKTQQWYEQWQAERETRLNQLRTMPYREYLQTPEWEETRKKAMKRAGFRCQVCNVYGTRLNVHHRTYERRGCEDNRDLIVLCEKCHGIFHESGKLVRER